MYYDKQNWDQSILLESQAADPDGISLASTYSAGELPLNGALTSGGSYTNNIGNFITIVCGGDETANIFTITGKDQAGRTWIVNSPGANAGTVTIDVPFVTISSIVMEDNAAGNVSIGISAQNATVWIPIDKRRQYLMLGMDVYVSSGATLNYTVEYTRQSVRGDLPPTRIFADANLAAETASGYTSQLEPWTAVRLRFNSWTTGNAVFETQQADDMHSSYKGY
jgi:hypothetical protein